MSILNWISDELADLEARDLLRSLPGPIARQGVVVEYAGRELVNFASNDYLGLAADDRLAAAAAGACRTSGVGRGASPLICGRAREHDALERRLAEFAGTEAALLFASGFAANVGTIPALVGPGDAIFADAKNHASLIDGCRLSRATTHVYPHGDADALERLLGAALHVRRRLIATDALFSMDGDLAPLPELAELGRRYKAMLLIDEAHATGVFGAHGRGAAEHFGVDDPAIIRVGTLSKSLGSSGGYVCGARPLVDWLANRARSYVFSTAHPAASCAAAMAALDIADQEPQRRERLVAAAAMLRQELSQRGWNTGASASQIIPIITGTQASALRLSRALGDRGLWVPAIRPPSVPPGESLLRVSVTASHTPAMLNSLLAALDASR